MSLIDKVEIQHNLSYDFLASMFRLNCNKELTTIEADDKFKFNEEIIKWVEETRNKLPENIKSSLDIFFNYETFYGMCLVELIAVNKPKDIEAFISYIENVPVHIILEKFLGTGYGIGEDEKISGLVRRMLDDEKYAIEFISSGISIPSNYKWEFLKFFVDPEKMKRDFIYLLKWYYNNIFKSEIEKIEIVLDKYEKELSEKLRRYGREYLEGIVKVNYENEDVVDGIVLAVSYYYERAFLQTSDEENNIDIAMMGYRHIDIFDEKHHSLLSSVQVFKALADETRLNIIKLLSSRPWYGHELAQKLGLSNSTVSHHLSMLTYSGLVRSDREENRLYYSVDMENIKKILFDSVDKMVK